MLAVSWMCCQALQATLSSVLVSLEREVTEQSEPMAAGLIKLHYTSCVTYSHFGTTLLYVSSNWYWLVSDSTQSLPQVKYISDNGETNMHDLRHVLSTILKKWNLMPANIDSAERTIKDTVLFQLLFHTSMLLRKTCQMNFQMDWIDQCVLPFWPETSSSNWGGGYFYVIKNSAAKVEALGQFYGAGTCPIINTYDMKSGWSVFALYMVQNCKGLSMQGILQLLSSNSTLQSLYPNLAVICQILPVSTVDSFSTIKTCLCSVIKTRIILCVLALRDVT